MTDEEIRLECLKLAERTTLPNGSEILFEAKRFYSFVACADQAVQQGLPAGAQARAKSAANFRRDNLSMPHVDGKPFTGLS
jgi:hypothetical protein